MPFHEGTPNPEANMATPQLMRSAAERMEEAEKKLREVRETPFTPEATREWLEALTQYALALGEVQEYSQQSIHEKLHALMPKRQAG